MGPLGKGSAKGWHGLGSAAIYPEASVQRGWGFGPWLLYRFPVTLLGMGCQEASEASEAEMRRRSHPAYGMERWERLQIQIKTIGHGPSSLRL